MNIQERIEALEAEYNERLKALKAEAQREQEFPQDGHWYWYITSDAGIGMGSWGDFEFEKEQLSIENVFRTREEAEFSLEKLKVEAELREFSRPFKCGEINRYIFLDTNSDCIDLAGLSYSQYQGTIYFESEEKAQQAIEAVGEERIKKYIFGVEDDEEEDY